MAVKYVLKPLGENSWLLLADGDRVGLVTEIDGDITVIGKLTPKSYSNMLALETHLGGKIVIEDSTFVVKEPISGDINGFPIKHNSHANVALDPFPSYTKTEKTKERYAAGYWALKFQQGWTHAFCPRLATLAEYDNIGPYTTKLEMQHQISQKNKEIRV
jgi:hypothetical protein